MRNFRLLDGRKLKLPLFFPDATRAVVRTLDSNDLVSTKTPGILVNSYHLINNPGLRVIKKAGGIRKFMGWNGAIISDSGGFQIMSLVKKGGKSDGITDKGFTFKFSGQKKVTLTPEESVRLQIDLETDLIVVLDDFTPPKASRKQAQDTVKRTLHWAKRSKDEFEKRCKELGMQKSKKPYLIGVVQGGEYLDLRKTCTKELVKLGFDGLGYGGWPITTEGEFNYEVAKVIANNSPKNYLLYGLGIGKPDEIVNCVKLGYMIFDCVLPTRDARHKRLYVYNANSLDQIDVTKPKFYSFYTPDKQKYYDDLSCVSRACDCLLCANYSKSYLGHLFRIKDVSAMRLATIHNLRFYSILMEKLCS